jgi:hypothetical protein
VKLAAYEQLAEILLTAEPRQLPPPKPLRLALDLAIPRDTRLLVIGGPLPAIDFMELTRRSCAIVTVGSIAEGLERLHREAWNAVAVSPTLRAEGDGVRFVRSLKRTTMLPTELADLVPRYAQISFVLLPLSGTTEFAIFRTASDWHLGDTQRVPLSRAILHAMSELGPT